MIAVVELIVRIIGYLGAVVKDCRGLRIVVVKYDCICSAECCCLFTPLFCPL